MTDHQRCSLAAHLQAIINKHLGSVQLLLDVLAGGFVPDRDQTIAAWVAGKAIPPAEEGEEAADYLDRTLSDIQRAHGQFRESVQDRTGYGAVTFFEIGREVAKLRRAVVEGRLSESDLGTISLRRPAAPLARPVGVIAA